MILATPIGFTIAALIYLMVIGVRFSFSPPRAYLS